MVLSFARLQQIIREEDAKRAEKSPESAALPKEVDVVASTDLETLKAQLLDRPVPATLFKSPVSAAQTTLVQWSSLSKPTQQLVMEQYPKTFNLENAQTDPDAVVEIPKRFLEVEEENNGSMEQNRPVQGNLREKLSEYTRGMTGQARPFRPGGGIEQEVSVDVENPYLSPEHLARDAKLLAEWPRDEDGVKKAWQEGLLLTAPPGVDFKIGLSIQEEKDDSVNNAIEQNALEMNAPLSADQTAVSAARSSQPTQNLLYNNASYFVDNEIDSLFGSSTESIYEAEEESEEEGKDPIDERNSDNDGPPIPSEIPVLETENDGEKENEDMEVDALLFELTESTEKNNKRNPFGSQNNPLVIAKRQAQDQQDSKRKVWASTKLLPIDDFDSFVPNPALKYPFILDGFQQQAIARLERNENVFVAAHTSAGKTVVAEYAVALAMRHATRCVYTSPIKALSNQKFRDFALKFGAPNVGLLTGDLQVNAGDSTCLIMTTEILRSMLYRGADLIRDIEYVVFDEVHYINDSERGVVWEEVLIMLPAHVTVVLLSATTPNTLEFSEWIGRTRRRPVYVVKTDYRPVPLSFNLWAGGSLHKVLQGKSGFLSHGYSSAAQALLPASLKDPKKKDTPKARRPASGSKAMVWQVQGDKSNWISLVHYLDKFVMTPTVIFSFSKKKCEEIARMLGSIDLNTSKERSAVQGFTIQAVARLSQDDAKLPQVEMVCEMVQRGIGIHHGGLLPILKETVEILFSRNLIKILLATETFAMGVNMPAKAVVFNSIRKHDGTQFRNLEPGEMTQMAGRAGRRGLDDVGTVIITCFGEEPPPENVLRQMLTGSSTRLKSQFRLTYNMILNLLRVEEMSVESMIKRSFSEFATQRALTANNFPQLLARGRKTLAKLEKEALEESASSDDAEELEAYFAASKDLLLANKELVSFVKDSDHAAFKDMLAIGRLILVTSARAHDAVRRPAIILKLPDDKNNATQGKKEVDNTFVCLLLLPFDFEKKTESAVTEEGTVGFVGSCLDRQYKIAKVKPNEVLLILDKKVKVEAKDILKEGASKGLSANSRLSGRSNPADMFAGFKPVGRRDDSDMFAGMKAVGKKNQIAAPHPAQNESPLERVMKGLKEMEDQEIYGKGAQALNLRTFVQRGNDILRWRQVCEDIEYMTVKARSFASHQNSSIEKLFLRIERRDALKEKVFALQHFLSNESLALFPDFLQRKEVLKRLGYLNENDTVHFKGRVACEVNTCEELIATEMVFEGILSDLKPEEIVAALSALVFQEKNESELDSELPESLVECCENMKKIATNLGAIQKECGLHVDPMEYREQSLNFGLVHPVYEWALGISFANICQLTDVQEGSIVRTMTRLDELCREIRNCARVVGNPSLYCKMEEASMLIKRDVVFCPSLYV